MQPVAAGGATSIIPAAAMAAPAPAAPRAVAAALAVLHRHQHLPAPARPLHRVRAAAGLRADRVGERPYRSLRISRCSRQVSPACRSEEHTSELQSLMRNSYDV